MQTERTKCSSANKANRGLERAHGVFLASGLLRVVVTAECCCRVVCFIGLMNSVWLDIDFPPFLLLVLLYLFLAAGSKANGDD